MQVAKFNPEIIAFCCHYCAYAAADLAGSMRVEYPPEVKVIEIPCSAKVDPVYILRAFEDGVDGVMAAG
jgi:coenzyme F420-reducing hydrogenase delta subunit